VKRETKKRLSAKDLRDLGANPARPRLRVPPPEGAERAVKPKDRGTTDRGEGLT
jgi:hypothetical protein